MDIKYFLAQRGKLIFIILILQRSRSCYWIKTLSISDAGIGEIFILSLSYDKIAIRKEAGEPLEAKEKFWPHDILIKKYPN